MSVPYISERRRWRLAPFWEAKELSRSRIGVVVEVVGLSCEDELVKKLEVGLKEFLRCLREKCMVGCRLRSVVGNVLGDGGVEVEEIEERGIYV